MSGLSAFRFVRTIGTVLTAEALVSAAELRMPGQGAADYQLPPGTAVNAAVARSWDTMLAAHREWHKALEKLPEGDPAIKVTREKWLLPLLYELGWGRVEAVPAGLEVQPGLGDTTPVHFPVSHRWSYPDAADPTAWVPLHLLGAGVNLDTKTANVTARAPQSMVQDYLNREGRALWAVLSNGRQLRLLRDASALTRQSYVEFDLDEIFANQLYADFRLLFLTAHASRFAPQLTAAATKKQAAAVEDEGSDESDGDATEQPEARLDLCWLERWRVQAIDIGSRARLKLQDGIAVALEHLGNGFLACPDNIPLREHLANVNDADRDLHRALLRIAYRLIVLFVAEDRGLLHTGDVPAVARQRYANFFSTARLRRLVDQHAGGRHTDLWQAHQIVTEALAGEGLPALGLSGLGATLFGGQYLGILDGARLPNYAFLAAIKALSQIDDPLTGTPRPVDYQNLDSEEFGGMYEGLLAYTPRYDPAEHTFSFTVAAGNERKKSGAYYTPSELIDVVLSEALDPLIGEAVGRKTPEEREKAILDLTVVDPACGSGHFLVAAARRLATALAEVRTGDTEPSPAAVRAATADVIERCMYGVDLNDLAIEITKIALWLEAFDAARPFPFLDAHFRVGNALLGTTPALLKENIPDSAFAVLGEDDKDWTSKLKARNKAERQVDENQFAFDFGPETLDVSTTEIHNAAQDADSGTTVTLAQLRARADAWRRLEDDPVLQAKKVVADAWCAAFVQPKGGHDITSQVITYRTLQDLVQNPEAVPSRVLEVIRILARRYRFFHWHLEFPGIFTVGGSQDEPGTGWAGGFSCVIGNPPWERVKIQDKEFFGNLGRTDIADAATAALRKKLIDGLKETDPGLHRAYISALRESDGTAHLLLKSGRYPFTGQGDVNTYSVFAETMRTITSPQGAAGILSPTGLATDKTTAPFFADCLRSHRLQAFYDFENEAKIFRDVHNQFRFALTSITGSGRRVSRTRFAFYTRYIVDIPERRFELAAEEVLAINPNTGTMPMFRSRRDADITLGIYSRFSVLIRDSTPDGNPWGLSFARLFDMANDSGLFRTADDLAGAQFDNWCYTLDRKEYVPLYEAKMLSHFDHRYATYSGATQAQLNKGTLPRLNDDQHEDPEFEPRSKYWVNRECLGPKLNGKWDGQWLLGWRGIARASDSRTFVPSVLPASAVSGKFPIAFPTNVLFAQILHALWSTLVFDYVARQKLSGADMAYFIVKQLAAPSPAEFYKTAPWSSSETIADWTFPHLLELSYTSLRIKPYAEDMGDSGPPFRWDPERRARLRADLDAGFIHVFGLDRSEAEHVLDSFNVVRKYEERDYGEYRTRRLVLEAYDRMARAIANGGKGWRPLADPPAGQGPRHPNRT
jgi:hypothetical protein